MNTPAAGRIQSSEERLKFEHLNLLYAQLPSAVGAQLLCAVVLCYVLSVGTAPMQLWSWLAVNVLISLLRLINYLTYRFDVERYRSAGPYERMFLAGAFASGCAWGYVALFHFPVDNFEHQVFLGFVIAGLTAGAVSSLASVYIAFLLFVLPMCFSFTLALGLQRDELNTGMLVLMIGYIMAILTIGKRSSANVDRMINLTFERAELANRLETNNKKLVREIDAREDADRRLRESLAELADANRAKSQFLAHMSHEIRTPMNGIVGMADILSRSSLSERQQHQLGLIQISAGRLSSLINDILDLARVEAGRVDIEKVDFDLWDVAGDAVDLLAEHAQGKGIEIVCEIKPDVSQFVVGDSLRLHQVLVNLISNAVKFTDKGSVVLSISSVNGQADEQTRLRFSVRDTGAGITPETMSLLFKAFEQGDAPHAKRQGGAGLGLAISHDLVELMGGQLNCVSTPETGTEFAFDLPLDTSMTIELTGNSTCGANTRVLLVDQDQVSSRVLIDSLAALAFEVSRVKTGQSAIRALKQAEADGTSPEFLLVNAQLTDMAINELISQVHAELGTAAPRIIQLLPIAFRGTAVLSETFAVTKPIRISSLLDAMNLPARQGTASSRLPSDAMFDAASQGEIQNFGLHVLVVEDNPVNREVAAGYLKELGSTCEHATTGEEAVSLSANRRFDLIFMDCELPDFDGFEATRRIRTAERQADLEPVPIIALTARAFETDRAHCMAAGMDDYLPKPLHLKDLIDKLEQIVGEHSRSDAVVSSIKASKIDPQTRSEPTRPDGLVAPDVIDRSVLEKLRANSPNLLHRLITIFLSSSPDIVSSIATAASEEAECLDQTAISRLAHNLKSSSAVVGADALARACKQFEEFESDDKAEIRLAAMKITAEYQRAEAHLKRVLDDDEGEARLLQTIPSNR